MASTATPEPAQNIRLSSLGRTFASSERASSAVAFEEVGKQPRQSFPRPAQPFTWELTNHSKAYLEARQYVAGFTFLNMLLTSGTSISTPAKTYLASLAPPAQLALASTIIVVPSAIVKMDPADAVKGANAALRYLRNIQTTIYPVHASLKSAFSFSEARTRRRAPDHRSVEGTPSPGPDNDHERLRGTPATSQSLWCRAVDFWHIVGWAFNCSIAHKKRWSRWKLWLDLMLDFLEADWQARLKLGRTREADADVILMESIIWQYVASEDPTSRTHRRRIVKAIFAMATSDSRKEFAEVWEGETLEKKRDNDDEIKPFAKIDIENGEFGNYASDDEDVDMKDAPSIPRRSTRQVPSRKSSSSSIASIIIESKETADRLGGMDAVQLRQRILALLTSVATSLPSHFTKLGDLFDQVTEVLLPLPISVFGTILSTSTLSGLEQVALNANLLLPLVAGQLPDYTVIAPTQSHFENILLPARATTQSFATNAKISLVVEQMFIYMMNENLLQATDRLRTALESGLTTRGSVYGTARGKRGNAEEEEQGKIMMEASSARLLGLLEVLEISAGKQPQESTQKSRALPLLSSMSSLSSPPESDTEGEDD